MTDDRIGRGRFQALWQSCLIDDADDTSAEIHQHLLDAYRESQRFYHTLAHIEHCFGMFDQCESLLDHPEAVELAIWFHDVIYEPGACDNEARSAELYQQLAGMTGTAMTEADEFMKIYSLNVINIPTNKPIVRDDRDDLISAYDGTG